MSLLSLQEDIYYNHVCLYVYNSKLNKLSIFDNVMIIENTFFPDNPKYYIQHYWGSNCRSEYTVSPNSGEVIYGGGTFKAWFTKPVDNTIALKTLINYIDDYASNRIKKATDVIDKMTKLQNSAREKIEEAL